MKRDFTGDNLGRIALYLNDANDEKIVWNNLISFFVVGLIPSISSLFDKLISSIISLIIRNDDEPSGEELKWYYRNVVDKNEKLKDRIKTIFEAANEKDVIYAQESDKLLSVGNEILAELEYLIDVATPASISNIAQRKFSNIIIPSLFEETSISDEDLQTFCNGEVKVDYSSIITEANSAINDIGFTDMFLLIIFNFKGVAIDAIVAELNQERNGQLKKWIIDNILKGKEGFISVQEISERTGLDVKLVRKYLTTGTINSYDLGYGKLEIGQMEYGGGNLLGIDADLKKLEKEIDAILAQQLKEIAENEVYLQLYCEENNLDIKQVEALLSGDINAYEKELYKKNISAIVEEVGKYADHKKTADLHLSGAKSMLDNIMSNKKLLEKTTDVGKLWNDVYDDKKKTYNDEKIKTLLNGLGYSNASNAQINTFKGIYSNIEGLGGVSKVFGRGQEIADAIAYLTADFSQEISILDKLIENAEGNASYISALNDLKNAYSNKYREILWNTQIESLEKKVIEEGVDIALKPIEIPLKAINIIGKASGASNYTENVLELMAFPEIADQMLKSYNASIENVVPGNTETLDSVRMNFAALKQTLSSYYEKCDEFYAARHGSQNSQRAAYSTYMKTKIDNMQLGKPFEFLSFDEYIEQYSI